jgi:hypothetical protein
MSAIGTKRTLHGGAAHSWLPRLITCASHAALSAGEPRSPRCDEALILADKIKGLDGFLGEDSVRRKHPSAHTCHVAFGTMQPDDVRFHRLLSPLKRVTDSGAMSMRQNDCGGAPIACTMAARMMAECVTTIDLRW